MARVLVPLLPGVQHTCPTVGIPAGPALGSIAIGARGVGSGFAACDFGKMGEVWSEIYPSEIGRLDKDVEQQVWKLVSHVSGREAGLGRLGPSFKVSYRSGDPRVCYIHVMQYVSADWSGLPGDKMIYSIDTRQKRVKCKEANDQYKPIGSHLFDGVLDRLNELVHASHQQRAEYVAPRVTQCD